MTQPQPRLIDLGQIVRVAECRMRLMLREDKIKEYEGRVRDGETPPPLDITETPDGRLILTNGEHRYEALIRAEQTQAACLVTPGTLNDAILRAAEADNDAPLNRTKEDKQFALRKLLALPEVADTWSEHKIARTLRVTRKTVKDMAEAMYPGWSDRQRNIVVQRGDSVYELRPNTNTSTRRASVNELLAPQRRLAAVQAALANETQDQEDSLLDDTGPGVDAPPPAAAAASEPTWRRDYRAERSDTPRSQADYRHTPTVVVTRAQIRVCWTLLESEQEESVILDDPQAWLRIPPAVRDVLQRVFGGTS